MEYNERDWSAYSDWQGQVKEPKPAYPTGKKEALFALAILLCGVALCNFTLFGGFNLGFSIAAVAGVIFTFIYLLWSGCKPNAYSIALLVLSVAITAGFARSNDGFVKFILLHFLVLGVNLGLCVMAGQNRFQTGSAASLLDAPRTLFGLGIGRSSRAMSGLSHGLRRSGSVGQKGGAFLLGLCVALPVLAIMLPLLISADAAFDGLVSLLPDFEAKEFVVTLILAPFVAILLYNRGVALRHDEKEQFSASKGKKGVNAITVNTALGAVCFVYVAYLVSQLAYFSGGFSGILPKEFTMAEYARRGFFEMATLCGINLAVMVAGLGVVRKECRAPLATRLLCLFVGVVTLFLVATASAKMFMYIGSYGLTRLRVLTQIIMLFMALTTGIVMVWLFVPKLPYMKAVLLIAMVIGTATLWADVNTQVARYNVDAYLSGKLEQVDFRHLMSLNGSAIPQITRLAEEAPDEEVAKMAKQFLENHLPYSHEDFRGWNYVNHAADGMLPKAQEDEKGT